VESKLGPLGTSATEWPIVPAPGDCDDGEFGWMKTVRGNRSTWRKPAPAPLCSSQILHKTYSGQNYGLEIRSGSQICQWHFYITLWKQEHIWHTVLVPSEPTLFIDFSNTYFLLFTTFYLYGTLHLISFRYSWRTEAYWQECLIRQKKATKALKLRARKECLNMINVSSYCALFYWWR
jgi:hypothetical protein